MQAWRSAPVAEAANVDPAPDPSWSAAPAEKRTALDRQGLIRKVQALLTERGYDPGPADGQAGSKTKAAVKAFQSSVGLQANGEIDANLAAILSKKTS